MLAQPFEDAQVFLPKYLSPEQQKQLYEELQKFPEKLNYYMSPGSYPDNVLQGDGWRGFVVIDFETTERKAISAVVLSNSCDIDPKNQADSPRKILFAPIVRLQSLEQVLRDAGRGSEQIADKVSAIRKQHITTMFYLPELAGVMPESVALLDDCQQQPLHRFLAGTRSKSFTLSQSAFWIFLIKVSIHFTRLNEGVNRL
jgi:hypothetical protein